MQQLVIRRDDHGVPLKRLDNVVRIELVFCTIQDNLLEYAFLSVFRQLQHPLSTEGCRCNDERCPMFFAFFRLACYHASYHLNCFAESMNLVSLGSQNQEPFDEFSTPKQSSRDIPHIVREHTATWIILPALAVPHPLNSKELVVK